jgi:esterase/lipase superfamily enzyme
MDIKAMKKNKKTLEKLVNSFPKTYSRRPFDEENPNDIYFESDNDYIKNNHDACIWFLENAIAIEEILTLLATQ